MEDFRDPLRKTDILRIKKKNQSYSSDKIGQAHKNKQLEKLFSTKSVIQAYQEYLEGNNGKKTV